jgi:hypothetical protein
MNMLELGAERAAIAGVSEHEVLPLLRVAILIKPKTSTPQKNR